MLIGKKEHFAVKDHPLCVIFRSLLRLATHNRFVAVFETDNRGQPRLPILKHDFSYLAHGQCAHIRVCSAHVDCQPELRIPIIILQ